MSQPIQMRSLREAPGATFEEPFEMLEACHERVHRMLKLLARLRAHIRDNGVDAQAQQAARDVMRYFDIAAPHHHMDEELHVFPPLLAQGDARIADIVRRLQQDHLLMETRWRAAREVLVLVAEASVQQLSGDDDAALDAFAGVYDDHIATEEGIAYPAAKEILDADAIQRASEDMARRRGVK